MSMNHHQHYPQPYVVLPSIQSMLNGAQAQYYYTHQSHKPSASIYQLQTLEPSLQGMNTAAYHPSRHIRHYSDVTHSRKQHRNSHRHEHRRAESEHTFDHAQKISGNCMVPNSYYDQQDSEDSSSGCSTPPPQQQPSARLQGLALDKGEASHVQSSVLFPHF